MWALVGMVVLVMWLSFAWITGLRVCWLVTKCAWLSQQIRSYKFQLKYTRKEK